MWVRKILGKKTGANKIHLTRLIMMRSQPNCFEVVLWLLLLLLLLSLLMWILLLLLSLIVMMLSPCDGSRVPCWVVVVGGGWWWWWWTAIIMSNPSSGWGYVELWLVCGFDTFSFCILSNHSMSNKLLPPDLLQLDWSHSKLVGNFRNFYFDLYTHLVISHFIDFLTLCWWVWPLIISIFYKIGFHCHFVQINSVSI